VVSLAAALALPVGFPERDTIVLLAFCAILVTLVVQGTTLGPLIRCLGVEETRPESPVAKTIPVRAALARAAQDIAARRIGDGSDSDGDVARELARSYRGVAERITREGRDGDAGRLEQRLRIRLEAIQAVRAKLRSQLGADELDLETARALGEELDLDERRIRRALGED
jgi:CPA1 family monovalent cation:H+ antiporter